MKTIEFTYGQKTIHLYFNSQAMFDVMALEQELGVTLAEGLDHHTAPGADMVCRVAEILATQGEHCRRYLEYTHERIPTAQELRLVLTPLQMVELQTAVVTAVNEGYDQGKETDGDIDTGLAELEKKTNR